MVRKVPGNLRSQEFVFFLGRFFCPLLVEIKSYFSTKTAFDSRANLRLGNSGGKRGHSNHPLVDDRSPIWKFSVDRLDASKTNRIIQPQLIGKGRPSKRKTNMEIQYRPHIVHSDIDFGQRFLQTLFLSVSRWAPLVAHGLSVCPLVRNQVELHIVGHVSSQSFKGKRGAVPGAEASFGLNRD